MTERPQHRPDKGKRLHYLKIVAAVYLVGFILSAGLTYIEVKTDCEDKYIAWVACVFIILGLLQGLFELPPKRTQAGTPQVVLTVIANASNIRLDVIERLHQQIAPKFFIAVIFILTGWALKLYLPVLLETYLCGI